MRLQAAATPQDEEEVANEESRAGPARTRTPRSASRSTLRSGSTPDAYKSREDDLTAQINDEILETSLIELQNLRDIAEGGVTTQSMSARKRILKTLGQLQKMRREILGAYDGSVVYLVSCPTVAALEDLWGMCQSGKLSVMFHEAFITEAFKRRHRVKAVKLSLTIRYDEYAECRKQLQADANGAYICHVDRS